MLKIIKYRAQKKKEDSSKSEGQRMQQQADFVWQRTLFTLAAGKGGLDPWSTISSEELNFSLRM